MKLKRKYIIFKLLLIISFYSHSQNIYKLKINYIDPPKLFQELKYKKNFHSEELRNNEVNKIISHIYGQGFINALIDTGNFSNINIKPGEKYYWNEIKPQNFTWNDISSLIDVNEFFDNKSFNYERLNYFIEDLLKQYENNGYPFAKIKFNNINIIDNKINADLYIYKGDLIYIDTIILKNYSNLSISFIENYLGIKTGSLYSESKIQKINERLNKFEFADINRSTEILFNKSKASIIIYLKEKSTNILDGIIGFQSNKNNNKRLKLNGNFLLSLNNNFKKGEKFYLNWQSSGSNSQFLALNYSQPYILKSKLGASYKLDINKNDSLYINTQNKFAILFSLGAMDYLSTYTSVFNSTVTSENISNSIANINYQSYGIELSLNKTDKVYFPTKGYTLLLQIEAANRKINKENDTNINGNSIKINNKFNFTYYYKIIKRLIISYKNNSTFSYSKKVLYNELERIGGFATIRGFNEKSIFAQNYSINSFEMNYLLSKKTYIGVFSDLASTYNPEINQKNNFFQSYGISFKTFTETGIFSMAYSIGKATNTQFLLRNAKIHFGYSAIF